MPVPPSHMATCPPRFGRLLGALLACGLAGAPGAALAAPSGATPVAVTLAAATPVAAVQVAAAPTAAGEPATAGSPQPGSVLLAPAGAAVEAPLPPPTTAATLEDAVARAIATSPELAVLEHAIAGQRLAVRLEAGAVWQKAQLHVGADADTRTGGVLQTQAAGVNAGIGLNLSIFDVFARGDRVAKEEAALARLEAERSAVRRGVRKVVTQQWFAVRAARGQAETKDLAVRAAQADLARVRGAYADARATSAELSRAVATVGAAGAERLRAWADAWTQHEELAQLLGEREGQRP